MSSLSHRIRNVPDFQQKTRFEALRLVREGTLADMLAGVRDKTASPVQVLHQRLLEAYLTQPASLQRDERLPLSVRAGIILAITVASWLAISCLMLLCVDFLWLD